MPKITLIIIICLIIAFSSNCFSEDHLSEVTRIKHRYPRIVETSSMYSYLIKKSPDSGVIIHETFPEDVCEAIIEDVIFLLPLDLVQSIAGTNEKYKRLLYNSRFAHKYDYWLGIAYNKYSRDYFDGSLRKVYEEVERYSAKTSAKLSIDEHNNADEELIDSFAKTIKSIVEFINAAPIDPSGEFMSYRMSQFMQVKNTNYMLRYNGDANVPVPKIIEKYENLRHSKTYDDLFYAGVVTTTAELWTSIWKSAGYEQVKVPKQVFMIQSVDLKQLGVKPAQVDLDFSKIKDYTELSIVLNRDHLMHKTGYISELIEKRIDDFAYEKARLDKAYYEADIIKKMKGIQDPVPIYKGKTIYDAVKFQQDFFNHLSKTVALK